LGRQSFQRKLIALAKRVCGKRKLGENL